MVCPELHKENVNCETYGVEQKFVFFLTKSGLWDEVNVF